MSAAHADRYDDALVRVDPHGVRLARYYFPLGRPRSIPWDRLRGYERRPMGVWSGRLRGWGSTRPDRWFALDLRRYRKRELVVLDVEGVKPAVTPDDPDAFCAALDRGLRSVRRVS